MNTNQLEIIVEDLVWCEQTDDDGAGEERQQEEDQAIRSTLPVAFFFLLFVFCLPWRECGEDDKEGRGERIVLVLEASQDTNQEDRKSGDGGGGGGPEGEAEGESCAKYGLFLTSYHFH